jgi:hypothetical protein
MLAKATGVSLRSVQRILEANQLAPHRVRTFKLSTDPKFAEKLRDVVGLYVDPPAMRSFSRSTRRDPVGVGGDRRSSRVRLLPDSLWWRPTQIVTDRPKCRPLSALTLADFCLLGTQSINLWLHQCHRAAEKRCRSIQQFAAAMSLACGRGSSQLKDKVQIRMGQVVPMRRV